MKVDNTVLIVAAAGAYLFYKYIEEKEFQISADLQTINLESEISPDTGLSEYVRVNGQLMLREWYEMQKQYGVY